MIRSVETSFAQTDAGLGVYYFVYAVAYTAGSLLGGLVTERLGRRIVLPGAGLLMAVGLILLAIVPWWVAFVAASVPVGLGIGALDGGVNGLFLDLYTSGRARALNLLHLSFSIGALSAPLAIGRLIETGIAWQHLLLVGGLVAIVVAGLFLVVTMPDGRHQAPVVEDRSAVVPAGLVSLPLILLAIAIAGGVAMEIGVANWLIRFLDPAPLGVATTGLTLFLVGVAAGRLFSARFADRFDHRRFATVAASVSGLAVLGAVVAPAQPVSIAMFGLAGFGIGPIYPMIIVVAGERYPGRSAAVSGFLGSAALAGTIVYPPLMGFMSVTIGLGVAMLGNAVLAGVCAVALVLIGRVRVTGTAVPVGTVP